MPFNFCQQQYNVRQTAYMQAPPRIKCSGASRNEARYINDAHALLPIALTHFFGVQNYTNIFCYVLKSHYCLYSSLYLFI